MSNHRGKPFFYKLIMCLYPRLIRNPKYEPNKKNGGKAPEMKDKRLGLVPIGCGQCIECRRQKANEWRVRLNEEIKTNKGYFVTLTFNEESLNYFWEICEDPNEDATMAVRLFCERWRKKYKKAPRHWFITELGHENTERLHLHGIIFCNDEQIKNLERIWSYGWTHIGEYCNEKSINYITKYILKIDEDHKLFKGKIFASKGIGLDYLKRERTLNKYNGSETKEYYKTDKGTKLALPIAYRNKLYSEDEREQLWLNKIDEQKRYINGICYYVRNSSEIEIYLKALKEAQKANEKLGLNITNWNEDVYRSKNNLINNFAK